MSTRGSALWGKRTGGSGRGRARTGTGVRVLLLAVPALTLALLVPGVASSGQSSAALVPQSLLDEIQANPGGSFPVVIQGDGSEKSDRFAGRIGKELANGSDPQRRGREAVQGARCLQLDRRRRGEPQRPGHPQPAEEDGRPVDRPRLARHGRGESAEVAHRRGRRLVPRFQLRVGLAGRDDRDRRFGRRQRGSRARHAPPQAGRPGRRLVVRRFAGARNLRRRSCSGKRHLQGR